MTKRPSSHVLVVFFYLIITVALASCGGGTPPSTAQTAAQEDIPLTVYAPIKIGQNTRLIALPYAKPAQRTITDADLKQNPTLLIGRAGAETERLFGTPSIERRDGASLIRQYYVRACAMDVFLYDETADGNIAHAPAYTPTYVIEHVTIRVTDGDQQACVNELLRKKAMPYADYLKQRG